MEKKILFRYLLTRSDSPLVIIDVLIPDDENVVYTGCMSLSGKRTFNREYAFGIPVSREAIEQVRKVIYDNKELFRIEEFEPLPVIRVYDGICQRFTFGNGKAHMK